MPSAAPFWAVSLSKRVRRLERAIQPDQRAQWRAYLEQRFADPEYDEHRAALIAALLSDAPQYTFSAGELAYLVTWWRRDHDAPVVVRLYANLFAAI